MEKRILIVFALFFMLTGFNGENRIVEQNGVNLQTSVGDEYYAPTIIEKPRISVSEDGSEVTFQVRFKTSQAPSVTWYRYSLALVVDGDYRHRIYLKKESKYEDIMSAMLVIKNPTSEDFGIYRVRLKNGYGETTAEFLLSSSLE